MKLSLERINQLQSQLEHHPLLSGNMITDPEGLRIFMEHHVYAVWDFMSLIKTMQHHVCPSTECWTPPLRNNRKAARLINQIVLGEETDVSIDGQTTISHFDLYCQAMSEVGADSEIIEKWIESIKSKGFRGAKRDKTIPPASLEFMESTFKFIDSKKPHVVAAAFCFGRETVIPQMFTTLLDRLSLSDIDCPRFYYYLERHIEVDGDEHGPASVELVESLCGNNLENLKEAEEAAILALESRIKLWDSVADLIKNKHWLQEFFKRNS